tara:strand:- start:60862 stop:61524 length:663 start_codon:yes stop_codon:yes gene_type:complete
MKKFSLITLLLITVGLSSCTQENSTFLEEPTAQDLLKSFTLNKSTSGDYSLDYQLNNGAASDNVLDAKTNTSNIYLYSSENVSRSINNEGVALKDGELRISFNDTEKDKKYSITVLDEEIKASRSEDDTDLGYLNSYSVTTNNDGTFTLDFKVNEGVSVDYIFDADNNVYEIHLTPGEATESDFVNNFVKAENESMEIAFVNNTTESRYVPKKKPVIIFD